MYHDLDRAAAAEDMHPILATLAGQGIGDEEKDGRWLLRGQFSISPTALTPNSPSSNSQPRSRPPDECFQVLDADSSQAEAIAAALAGQSFVLHGPPGTGKSQTIANIIADGRRQARAVR